MMRYKNLFLSGITIFVLTIFLMASSVSAFWVLWSQTYGGEGVQGANSLVVTPDGGFALAGHSLLIKTDAYGVMEWNKTYDIPIDFLIALFGYRYISDGILSISFLRRPETLFNDIDRTERFDRLFGILEDGFD